MKERTVAGLAVLGLSLFAVVLPGCGGRGRQQPVEPAAESTGAGFVLYSPAFDNGGVIPLEYTGYGQDVSPQLLWKNPPAGTQSFALICEDPDAPGGEFIHWVVYDIPADRCELPRGISREAVVGGVCQGRNDFGSIGYRGPMPPPGRGHRYFFRLFALDTVLGLEPPVTAAELRSAMKGHILGEAGLFGVYRR